MVEIKHATDANFEELVLKAERPVVVDFWASWCTPCKLVAPEMEKLAAKYDGSVDVVKVDVDANPRLSQAFNILSIPTIAFFKPGAQPQGVVGLQAPRAARAAVRPRRVRGRRGRLTHGRITDRPFASSRRWPRFLRPGSSHVRGMTDTRGAVPGDGRPATRPSLLTARDPDRRLPRMAVIRADSPRS